MASLPLQAKAPPRLKARPKPASPKQDPTPRGMTTAKHGLGGQIDEGKRDE